MKNHFSISLKLVVIDFGKHIFVLIVLKRKVSEVCLICMTVVKKMLKKNKTKVGYPLVLVKSDINHFLIKETRSHWGANIESAKYWFLLIVEIW